MSTAKYIEKDAALERRFQKVLVDEPSVEDTIAILRGLKERYEVHHKVDITDPAIVAAAQLSHRYITDRQLPDKAIDLIDEAASRIRGDGLQARGDGPARPAADPAEDGARGPEEGKRRCLAQAPRRAGDRGHAPGAQRYADLDEVWKAEKAMLTGRPTSRPNSKGAARRFDAAKRSGDLNRMSELQCWAHPGLERRKRRPRPASRTTSSC